MDRRYLAKSSPEEDIQGHTDKLLENYNKLKSIYPNLNVNWDILYKACVYHDLGKMNIKFQERIKGKKHYGEIPHGILSMAFIDYRMLKKAEGYNKNDIKVLFHSIAYHHDRQLDFEIEDVEEEIENLKEQFGDFYYDKLDDNKFIADTIEDTYFVKNDRIYECKDGEIFYNYVMTKGLLNRLDYAASADIDVESKNDFLQVSLQNMMKTWQEKDKNAEWNDLQDYMRKNKSKNVIVIAQTGMGKTEAGLLWLVDDKGFFVLPLKSAINSIYDRIKNNIVKENVEKKVGLLHSETYSKYLEMKENEEDNNLDLDLYYNKTKQLSLPLTVCTLDQIFDFVYRYRGFEPKLATLSYSKVIIDEIQMYSPDLLAYLIIGLSYISKLGGKFAILTATLPSFIVDLLKNEKIDFEIPKTFVNKRIRHSIKVLDKEINAADIISKYNNNKVLVICNTVKTATKIYKELIETIDKKEVKLLHGNFTREDRRKKEGQILSIGSKESKEHGIWVTTQIVEASLDIDFDLLFTELSDLNGLFQRMGRCYRNRNLNVDYNCFVFTGGQKFCSGVGKFIDEYIFKLSKEVVCNLDGEIDERTKVDLISELYTTEKLKQEKGYYNEIIENIKYVKSYEGYELDKAEMQKRFRNMDTVTIIPRNLYEKNIVLINNCKDILQKSCDKTMIDADRKALREEKVKARNEIMEFTIDLQRRAVRNVKMDKEKINKYEEIVILECNYNSTTGIEEIVANEKKKDESFNDFNF
jgi:CRISPR-associated endonuclease/helicase Cas3